MVINGYQINAEIHRGPVTTVYDAYHIALDRRVLLKVLNTQWRAEEDLIERFRREAKICARLDHPNIVRVFDFATSQDSIFISMEYVEGSTLEMLIQQNKIQDISEIIRITLQILSGLSYAHKQGVIHRDIKPSNIMIADNGQVKITDFGLAAISDLPEITGQEQTVGSPAYMSPEQVLGKDLDPRTDLFSLGVCLYKMCTKKSPFESDNIGTTIQNILSEEVQDLSSHQSAIPEWYSGLIRSLLTKNREHRPDSAEEVLNIINTHLNGGDINLQAETNYIPHPANHGFVSRLSSKYINPKFQTRIFLWAFPIVMIFTYVLFMPNDKRKTEQIKREETISHTKGMAVPDSIMAKQANMTISGKNITSNPIVNPENSAATEINLSRGKNEFGSDSVNFKVLSEKSKIFIMANPWADIYIDSIYYETTPLTETISLSPGYHLIELKNPNYQTFSQKYYFESAQSETLITDLNLNVGFLNIRVLPWAKIYINGEYRETTPIENLITLPAGQHVVTLTNPGYASITDSIEIVSGKTVDKRFKLVR